MFPGWQQLLSGIPSISLAGVYAGVQSLCQVLALAPPDVLLLDHQYAEPDACALCREMSCVLPSMKILVVGHKTEYRMAQEWFKCGAQGYLLRTSLAAEVPRAIEAAADGRRFLSEEIAWMLLSGSPADTQAPRQGTGEITRRECEVLRLIVEEYTTAEIARKLFISEGTVETHRAHLIHKLGVRNTAGLVREAIFRQLYILHPEPVPAAR
ncbi:MAG: response regulator transcription factor [Bacteroidia bacterium]|nr:response regulator transcription factor [Bacteroidia bacterium]